jgi:hypothetical protein
MKRLIVLSTLITAVVLSACGQKSDASKVPAAVKTEFVKQFPGATAKWEKEDGRYEANFKQNGHEMSALFETDGSMTESEIEIKETELPAAVLAYVKKHYEGKKAKSAAKITKADGSVNWEVDVNGKDAIFDSNGNFLKEVKD